MSLAAKPTPVIQYADDSTQLSSTELPSTEYQSLAQSLQSLAQSVQSLDQSVMHLNGKVDELLCKERPTNESSSPTAPQLPQPQQPINEVQVEPFFEQFCQSLMAPSTANQHQQLEMQQTELNLFSMNCDQSANPPSAGFPSLPGPSISLHFSQPGVGCSVPGPSYSTPQMSYGPSASGWSNPMSSSQPSSHPRRGPYGLDDPENILKRIPGNDTSSLCRLTVELARYVVFGDEVLARSTVTGKNNKDQLDPNKLKHIKSIIRERAGPMGDSEFDLVWKKCKESLGRKCRQLRSKTNPK